MRKIFFFSEITVSCDRVLHLHQINSFARAYKASREFTFNLLSFINDEMDLCFLERKSETFCCDCSNKNIQRDEHSSIHVSIVNEIEHMLNTVWMICEDQSLLNFKWNVKSMMA